MASTRGKRLIPVELLRRSCRRRTQDKFQDQVEDEATISPTNIQAQDDLKLEDVTDIDSKKSRGQVEDKFQMTIKQEQTLARSCDDTTSKLSEPEKPSNEEESADGFLEVDSDELDLERTLMGGQSFRWKMQTAAEATNSNSTARFTGVIGNNVFQLWRCDDKRVAYKSLLGEKAKKSQICKASQFLSDYFQLKYNLKDLYEEWSQRDEHFKRCSISYRGFRILRQDPVENVFSFICATNNNIKRISLMVDKMCQQFGERLDVDTELITPQTPGSQQISGTTTNETPTVFYSFPTIGRLAQDDVFDSLRYKLGFGYRAKFICETAKKLVAISSASDESPRDHLLNLRNLPYKETCKALQGFPGIGRKVADCICLMSMDHLGSVPIDCHIYEIVCRNYMKTLRQERKTLTESVHDLIGDYFTKLHGPLAGWATSVLFIGELKHLKQPAQKKNKAKDDEGDNEQDDDCDTIKQKRPPNKKRK